MLAIRCLVSRIPAHLNKDLVFGNLMLLMLGAHSSVAVLLAALAFVTLVLHLTVIVRINAAELAAAGPWAPPDPANRPFSPRHGSRRRS
ncbi:hypothetical protein ACRAWD_26520 [Caulobacter segnis]